MSWPSSIRCSRAAAGPPDPQQIQPAKDAGRIAMNALPDGAIFAGQTTLEAKAKNITVVIQDSGHRPVQQ